MQTGSAGIALIKEFEGFRNKAYLDPIGIPTIGYGTTRIKGVAVSMGMSCTKEEAETWLVEDLKRFEELIHTHVKVPLTQNQFDALVSIIYNVGPGVKNQKDGIITLKNGNPSTLLRRINEQRYLDASFEFGKWIRAGGKVLSGLERRRAAEKNLFLTK